jgi:hypothetical protein
LFCVTSSSATEGSPPLPPACGRHIRRPTCALAWAGSIASAQRNAASHLRGHPAEAAQPQDSNAHAHHAEPAQLCGGRGPRPLSIHHVSRAASQDCSMSRGSPGQPRPTNVLSFSQQVAQVIERAGMRWVCRLCCVSIVPIAQHDAQGDRHARVRMLRAMLRLPPRAIGMRNVQGCICIYPGRYALVIDRA